MNELIERIEIVIHGYGDVAVVFDEIIPRDSAHDLSPNVERIDEFLIYLLGAAQTSFRIGVTPGVVLVEHLLRVDGVGSIWSHSVEYFI